MLYVIPQFSVIISVLSILGALHLESESKVPAHKLFWVA